MRKFFNCIALLVLVSCGPAAYTSYGPSRMQEKVNIGYGTATREQLTSSVSSVAIDDSIPYANIYEMIQGKCAGVMVRGTSILIRGVSSINLSTEPLILVDGIEVSDISHINPRDVKDIHILKDSAASIYGSRGANGVILITLK